ncbi:MAG: alpha/beta hydrolase [Planctomycetales bacterium]|nr:alpha/beta hydrolase [Planctomycetales bacterium]
MIVMRPSLKHFGCLAILLVAVLQSGRYSVAQDESEDNSQLRGLLNVPTPTLGGKQLWTDHFWRQDWTIQQNALTLHWRLLDANYVRRAWGSYEACRAELDRKMPSSALKVDSVVILMHGLMRSADSMRGLGRFLEQELDCKCIYFQYASTRASISEHAAALRDVVSSLPTNVKINFVGHSMGNIVVRHAIGDWQRAHDLVTLGRIEKVIMLGPPNQGAAIARQLSKIGLFEFITGQGGMELGPKWTEFESSLAVPHCPFAIVAGNLDNGITNPLVGADGDFVVSVEETKLPGATAFLEIPRLHSFIMDDSIAQTATLSFLQTGKFPARNKPEEGK